MGLTFTIAKVHGPRGRASVKFLVDSGASYTALPYAIWQKIGLKPQREMIFTLADGTEVRRKISECKIQFRGFQAHTPVILGEKTDTALLGAITLEILGLVLNPFSRTLEPMHAMLASGFSGRSRF
ncbi:MAG: retroviral-like aspartic protease family protein [Elusimicrobia bacterium]|nr:retroviral-like aspartic protease family protein [Elusimicrobiota bacterium]